MNTFKILTGICAIIFLQISSSYDVYGTPTMLTSKPQSTKGSLPPMSTSPGYLPSMTKSTTRVKTIIPTTKSVQVTTRSTKLPKVTTRTTKRPQTVETTTKRQQVTTKTWIRTQMTTQNMHTVTPKSSRQLFTPTSKEQDVIMTTTKRQDIPSEDVIPRTTAVPQPFPSGEPSNAEHVKQELRNHEDPHYGLMIGVPVGLVVITAIIFCIIWLCRRGTNCFKEKKKVSELSKGLSIVYEEKSASAPPSSYGNPVYGKLMNGNIIGKSSTTPEKPRRERTIECSTEKGHGSDRIYEEIPSVGLSVHGTMSSTNFGLKSSKETNASGEPLHTMNGYPDMKGSEYYYMRRNFLVKN